MSGGLPGELRGQDFAVSEATGQHALVPRYTVRLRFADGEVRVHAGCNTLIMGLYVDDGVLVAEDASSAQMACEPTLMRQDAWLMDFLRSRPSVLYHEGDVVLAGRDASLTLRSAP